MGSGTPKKSLGLTTDLRFTYFELMIEDGVDRSGVCMRESPKVKLLGERSIWKQKIKEVAKSDKKQSAPGENQTIVKDRGGG